jgi:hypothetical protein
LRNPGLGFFTCKMGTALLASVDCKKDEKEEMDDEDLTNLAKCEVALIF